MKREGDKLIKALAGLQKAISEANEVEEIAEKWDRRYINDLPNSAFAVVEKGYKEGGNKNARHAPHHNKNVKSASENSSVDLPHYRNALARVNQIKSVLGTESDAELRKKAAAHLEKHRAVLNKSKSGFTEQEMKIWEECETLFEENVKHLLEK